MFTGVPAKDYLLSKTDVEETWKILHEGHLEGHILGCGTKGAGDHSKNHKNGLAQSHAYSILDVRSVTDKAGKEHRMINMRNPWSTERFRGTYSDKDWRFWSNEMLHQLDHKRVDDGSFWISVEDFQSTMLYMVVSYWHPKWWHSFKRNEGDDGKEHSYVFDVPLGGEGKHYITIDHYDTRMYPFGAKASKVMTNFHLHKYNSVTAKYERLERKFGSDWIGFQMIKVDNLEPGHYKIDVKVKWVDNAMRDYTVGIYGKNPLPLFECVEPGKGNRETPAIFLHPIDRCKALIKGDVSQQGKRHARRDLIRSNDVKALLPDKQVSIEKVLHDDIMLL